MTGFVEGAYIDDERTVRKSDGSPDDLGRWVDDRGYVHLPNSELDENWFIDAEGQPHDGLGMPQGQKVGIPQTWSVELPQSADTVSWQGAATTPGDGEAMADAILQRQIAERNAGLSATQGTSPGPGMLDAFTSNIPHTAPATDAVGGDLTWAGGTIAADTPLPGGRELSPEYVGENERSTAFKPDTMRGKLDATNNQWTTEYDRTQTDSIAEQEVAGGLLCDDRGAPLNGTFGYVVDPSEGSIYTFDQGEGYVSKGGDWIPLSGLDRNQVIALIQKALTDGEKVSYVHHSSPLAGQPVAGAGQLTVVNGKITAINDESGHYKPEGEYLWQTITWLKQAGMPIDDIDVKLIAKGQEPELILEGWKFAQTGGNQAQARLKQGVINELDEKAREDEIQRKVASFATGSREAVHYARFKCADLDPDAGRSYCMSCDNDL
jgi:hypothetical protein